MKKPKKIQKISDLMNSLFFVNVLEWNVTEQKDLILFTNLIILSF